jgi:hypothetical protein
MKLKHTFSGVFKFSKEKRLLHFSSAPSEQPKPDEFIARQESTEDIREIVSQLDDMKTEVVYEVIRDVVSDNEVKVNEIESLGFRILEKTHELFTSSTTDWDEGEMEELIQAMPKTKEDMAFLAFSEGLVGYDAYKEIVEKKERIPGQAWSLEDMKEDATVQIALNALRDNKDAIRQAIALKNAGRNRELHRDRRIMRDQFFQYTGWKYEDYLHALQREKGPVRNASGLTGAEERAKLEPEWEKRAEEKSVASTDKPRPYQPRVNSMLGSWSSAQRDRDQIAREKADADARYARHPELAEFRGPSQVSYSFNDTKADREYRDRENRKEAKRRTEELAKAPPTPESEKKIAELHEKIAKKMGYVTKEQYDRKLEAFKQGALYSYFDARGNMVLRWKDMTAAVVSPDGKIAMRRTSKLWSKSDLDRAGYERKSKIVTSNYAKDHPTIDIMEGKTPAGAVASAEAADRAVDEDLRRAGMDPTITGPDASAAADQAVEEDLRAQGFDPDTTVEGA